MNNEYEQQPVQQPVQTYSAPARPNIPEEYEPISVGGYIGYLILFGIPCVGFIVALILAFGGNKKINVKNLAKSYLVMLLIAIGISILISLLFGSVLFGIFNSIGSSY